MHPFSCTQAHLCPQRLLDQPTNTQKGLSLTTNPRCHRQRTAKSGTHTVGYYDHHPTVDIDKPFVITGFSGSRSHSVAHFLAAMTGLPLTDLDRQIEHHAGRSLALLQREDGPNAWRNIEAQLLIRALKESPPRLLAVGEGALLHAKARKAAWKMAHVVYIRRPRPTLLANIQQGLRQNPERYPIFIDRYPQDVTALEPLLATREPIYERAHTQLDVMDIQPVEVARLLASRLGWST